VSGKKDIKVENEGKKNNPFLLILN